MNIYRIDYRVYGKRGWRILKSYYDLEAAKKTAQKFLYSGKAHKVEITVVPVNDYHMPADEAVSL